MPEEPAQDQPHHRGKTAGMAVARYGCGDQALRRRHRDLGVGEQRRRHRTRCGHGLRGRRADAGDARRGGLLTDARARLAHPRRQHRRPDDAAASVGTPQRPVGCGFRLDLHDERTHHLRVPRLSLAHPPPDLSAAQSRRPARARLQRGRLDHDAVRHDGAQRTRPLPPGRRRDRSRAQAAESLRAREAAHP